MLAALLLLMTAPPRVPVPRPEPAAAQFPAPAPGTAGAPVVGGFAPMSRFAPELHKPFRAAVAAITPARHPGAHLLAAQRQVVAGINYRLTLKLRDGSRWQATVWHKLDGEDEVTQATRLD
ncbi:MAG TPA: hypothetical protein VN627_00670 [Novosphingobium sp.]|jgi:hypothetical protein|nr:hypothetical protein [Novosphingobium sp.]